MMPPQLVHTYRAHDLKERSMPRLTILNHWRGPVEITINGDDPVRTAPGGKIERDLIGPVQLRATATGAERGFIRAGDTADGLVQDRVLVLEVPDADAAELRFRVV
jgi:hypothetical protein